MSKVGWWRWSDNFRHVKSGVVKVEWSTRELHSHTALYDLGPGIIHYPLSFEAREPSWMQAIVTKGIGGGISAFPPVPKYSCFLNSNRSFDRCLAPSEFLSSPLFSRRRARGRGKWEVASGLSCGAENRSMGTRVEFTPSQGELRVARSEYLHGVSVNHKFLEPSEGVRIHFVDCGDPKDPPIIFLHGFPCFWRMWHRQLPFFAQRGFYVIAPDLRGYGNSGKPNQVKDYSKKEILKDLNALVDACSHAQPVTLVGHDWGGAIAWHFAHVYTDKVSRLAILNAPHPRSFSKALTNIWDPRQLIKSYYIFLFQFPLIPEIVIQSFDFHLLRTILKKDPAKGLSDEEIQQYVDVFSPSNSSPFSLQNFFSFFNSSRYPMSFALNYYRAAGRGYWDNTSVKDSKISCPVFVLWGEKDAYLLKSVGHPPPENVQEYSFQCLSEATHWLMWDEPEKINSSLFEFLKIAKSKQE